MPSAVNENFPGLLQAAADIVETSHVLYERGWSPATSSNYSVRLDQGHCAITVSGKDKGKLTTEDVMVVDMEGKAVTEGKPSAETGLHTGLYSFDKNIGAILHTHSVNATVLTMQNKSSQLNFEGYEIVKAFSGYSSHKEVFTVPVFDNNQNIAELSQQAESWLQKAENPRAYLIRGHGLYTWGADMEECFRHLEAMEFLLACQIKMNR